MSRPKSTRNENSLPARLELHAFAGLPQALARLILRDGRSRKEVAEAAELNASMLSGYCSGRRIPSLEHLDRLLTTLHADIEDLTYEMRTIQYKAPSPPGAQVPLLVLPQEGAEAGTELIILLENLRRLLEAQAKADAQPLPRPAPPAPGPERRPAKAPRRKRD